MSSLLTEEKLDESRANLSRLDQVKAFLDSRNARYTHFSYSDSHSFEEVQEHERTVENDLVEPVPVKITDKGSTEVIVIVVPATRKIDLASLREINSASEGQLLNGLGIIDFVGKQAIEQLSSNNEAADLPFFKIFHSEIRMFYSHEVFKLPTISFYVGGCNNRIRMPFDDFLAVSHPVKKLEIPTIAKYKAQIVRVSPEEKKLSLKEHKRCILGFSLQNENFAAEKLAGMAEWIGENFSECDIWVGDSIHRLTLEIQGLEPKLALNRGLRMGREIVEYTSCIFDRHQGECKYNFVLCSELQKDHDYPIYYRLLMDLFEKNDSFRDSVRSFARKFVRHHFHDESKYFEYHIQLSCTYFLEEAACLALLVRQGLYVFIYPGALTVLQELGEGLYPDAPEELKSFISVIINLKRR